MSISFCFAATFFSCGELLEISGDKELIDHILANKEYCTEDITAGKIYLKGEKIITVEMGDFLRIDDDFLVRLPAIFSDEKGRFISML